MPIRVQRKRTKGWKMPPNTVYVGRPTYFGNPFVMINNTDLDRQKCVDLYKNLLTDFKKDEIKKRLKGKNLACWCPLNKPCHADLLLKIANS